jgi:RND family efflux transporter MFP subunit
MKKYMTILSLAVFLLSACRQGNDGKKPEYDAHEHAEGEEAHHHEGEEGEHAHADEISFTKAQADAVGLEVEEIVPRKFHQVIKTSGQILSSQGDEASVVATSNGIVSFANASISEGSAVRAGQAILSISSKNLLDGDPSAKAKIDFETAQKEFQRAGDLVKDQIISDKDYEQIRARYETAKTVYEAQSGNVSAKGVAVTSPIGGYIKSRRVNEGDYVSVGQIVCTVSQNRRLQLRAEVSENHFGSLKSIGGANFQTAYDNEVYQLADLNGRLLSFGKASDENSFYVPVTFEFNNAGNIIPGSFVTVYLLSSPQDNVLSLPVSAITEEQGLYFAYIQLDEEGYKKQELKLGDSDGRRVKILSGLKAGDKVVTKGVYQVKLAATSAVMPEGHSH